MHEYEISDLGLATTLCCLGYTIKKLDRSNPKRVIFVFDNQKLGFEAAINDYWNGSLRLPPLTLFTHQKQLKQRLYANQS